MEPYLWNVNSLHATVQASKASHVLALLDVVKLLKQMEGIVIDQNRKVGLTFKISSDVSTHSSENEKVERDGLHHPWSLDLDRNWHTIELCFVHLQQRGT